MLLQPDLPTRRLLIRSLFEDETGDVHGYTQYFEYYTQTVETMLTLFSNRERGHHLYPRSHDDVLSLVAAIGLPTTYCTRPLLRDTLKQGVYHRVSEDTLNHLLELVIRLTVMINVGRGISTKSTGSVFWDDGQTLASLVEQHVGKADIQVCPNEKQISTSFTAATMINHCRLKIEWTDSIHEHLEVSKKGSQNVLRIFRHKAWMRCRILSLQRRYTNANNSTGNTTSTSTSGTNSWSRITSGSACFTEALPVELLEETLESINLLFPSDDVDTRELCHRKGWTIHEEQPLGRLSNRRFFVQYPHWQFRLLHLYTNIYEARPSWRNLWFDKRDPEHWVAVWVGGMLLLILTLISTVASVIQAVYTVKAA